MLTQATKANKRPIPYQLYGYYPLYSVETANNIFCPSSHFYCASFFKYSVKKKCCQLDDVLINGVLSL